jgi:hypothetical protein
MKGIEKLVSAYAGDEKRYRETLIHEVLSGYGRTLANIRRSLDVRPGRRIGSNRGEMLLPPGVSIFDLIEEWAHNDEGSVA